MHKQSIGRLILSLVAMALLARCGGESSDEPRFNSAYPIYADLLQRYVDEQGWVDYAGLKADSVQVRRARENLRAMSPDTLARYTPPQMMAYWINAYNLLLLEAITQFYPVDSTGNILNLFNRPHPGVAGQNVSLNEIDKDILLKQFSDPRTCFALCRGSVGGPVLSCEPYLAGKLQAQLSAAVARFITDTTRNIFNPEQRSAIISPFFEQYEKEFKNVYFSQIPKDQPEEARAVFNFIAETLPNSQGRFLLEDGVNWSYMPNDTRLNDAAKKGKL